MLLDIGNSRLKWALWSEQATPHAGAGRLERRGVLARSALRRSDAPLRALLAAMPPGTAILACNVAGAQIEARLRACATRARLPRPQFVRTAARAAGVRNGYAEPWRLGADRWVALIGAHAAWPRRALCLVGIGSALTIDLLAPRGRHLGGCIVPGPQMMIESLLRETAGIRRRAQLGDGAAIARALNPPTRLGRRSRRRTRDALFSTATREALLAGARHACAALIERAAQQARQRVGMPVQVVLSGGAADAIAPLLGIAHRRNDELVLQGLLELARAARSIA
ncbi:MAG TPA: type III pantothenate kinase [Steroidobacteraceae bacterium]|nr:type III pantothenate kinase [Steroidobacteraceae bacterium]